eukprot:6197642-Pleurochrysis_carterae.AAC.2
MGYCNEGNDTVTKAMQAMLQRFPIETTEKGREARKDRDRERQGGWDAKREQRRKWVLLAHTHSECRRELHACDKGGRRTVTAADGGESRETAHVRADCRILQRRTRWG